MKTIVNRLKEYLDYKSISVSIAEREINLSNASLAKPFNNNTSIKTETLEKFLFVYSDISPEWLLSGNGSMFKIEQKGDPPDGPVYRELSEARKEIIELLKKINVLEKEVGSLKEKININSSVERGAMEFLNEPKLGEKIGKQSYK